MDLVSAGSSATQLRPFGSFIERCHFIPKPCSVTFSNFSRFSLYSTRVVSLVSHAKRRASAPQQPPSKQTILEDEAEDGEAELIVEGDVEIELADGFEDEIFMEDNEDFQEDFEEDIFQDEEANLFVGDGAAGGGISLAGMWWDKEALAIAEKVSMSFDGDLKIYAFKTSANSTIRVRIEKVSTKYGSPSMDDIQAFSTAYRTCLDEAEVAGTIPDNITLEVSSPGLQRVVRIPEELERFKDKSMYVKYISDDDATATPRENDGVFSLISFDMELRQCTWGIADVKVNRQKAGKGRPLSKKQREWRLQTPFESLRLVRLHSDF
ncbi:hypothetical protein Cni_G20680 [Canna indica]|uniref:Ribosome maturation factor RimP N-terminal domain-containing protein n=1 Tax=Canna indica TaxID=4628 RepID=A0AAQ3QGH0_9LILI|nr:hypothetical protein Cni_G20680 [Canna indica]